MTSVKRPDCQVRSEQRKLWGDGVKAEEGWEAGDYVGVKLGLGTGGMNTRDEGGKKT